VRLRTALPAAVALLIGVGSGVIVTAQPFTAGAQPRTELHPATGESSCVLQGPAGRVHHVISITFDNVHLSRDNTNVPSDIEQIPALKNFITQNGALLSNEHTPLIAHTADDILTTLTGVYGATHGQPVTNDYRTYNTNTGSSDSESSFAYWTDGVTNTNSTDTAPTMDDHGKVMPAPWVPFTRAGCDVGAFATANMEIENPGTDLATIFGPSSPEVAQYNSDPDFYKDPEVADYEGIAVHCAKAADSVCSNDPSAISDTLSQEPGGYTGYQALFGNRFVAPAIGGHGAGGLMVDDLGGTPITNPYTGTPGFPGFDPTASQTLGYLAQMQEHGIPVTYGYIEDAHENYATGDAAGPGDASHESNLEADNNAFAQFFRRLRHDGITPANTLFVFSSDEGDHFAGTRSPTPTGCDGVTVFCAYPKGSIGELQATVNGLLKEHDGSTAPTDYQIEADTAPNFYVNGNPAPGGTDERTLEQELGALTVPDPYTSSTINFTNYLADKTEEGILHMVTSDPERTPTFTDFANPDLYVQTSSSGSCPTASSSETAVTGEPCVLIDPQYAWDHGDDAPEITTNWVGFVGPGVRNAGTDSTTWADETDVRPTLMYLTGLTDDYEHNGRVLFEDLDHDVSPAGLRGDANVDAFLQLGEAYKQLDAGVGEFGMDTLEASTIGLESTSASTYASTESALASLGAQRDTLAATIEGDLENVEFSGGSLSTATEQSLTTQAQSLITQAAALA
jgi:hypothetical protein